MILFEDKGFETRSDKPNEDWTKEALFVVEDNSELANKIIANYPYFDFMLKDGMLFDVNPTEKPPAPIFPEVPTYEERIVELEALVELLTERAVIV